MMFAMTADTADWVRLGRFVQQRRAAKGLSQSAAAASAGINRGVWSSIEKATGSKPYDTTIAAVERTLDWQPGSVDAVLGGGVPSLVDTDPRDATPEDHIALLHRWADSDPGLTDAQRQEFQTLIRVAEERIAKRRRGRRMQA